MQLRSLSSGLMALVWVTQPSRPSLRNHRARDQVRPPQQHGHPVSLGVKRFAELLLAKSGGKLKVTEYPSSTLGNELQQQSALQGGVQKCRRRPRLRWQASSGISASSTSHSP